MNPCYACSTADKCNKKIRKNCSLIAEYELEQEDVEIIEEIKIGGYYTQNNINDDK